MRQLFFNDRGNAEFMSDNLMLLIYDEDDKLISKKHNI